MAIVKWATSTLSAYRNNVQEIVKAAEEYPLSKEMHEENFEKNYRKITLYVDNDFRQMKKIIDMITCLPA